MNYNRHEHGDFKMYFDTDLKKHYWLLGYFGGGSINISEIYELAKDFSQTHNVPLENVLVDEIQDSRRFKYFKYITCDHWCEDGRKIVEIPHKDAYQTDGVYKWFRD